MFDWLRRVLKPHAECAVADNAVESTKVVGTLALRTRTLVLRDPQYPGLEVPNIATAEIEIHAVLMCYADGFERIRSLTLRCGDRQADCSRRKLGEIEVDSGKLLIADKADLEEHWTEVGKDRIGVISIAPDDTVLRTLIKRFQLKTVRVNAVRAEVVGPVTESLEQEIEDFLKSQHVEYSHMLFRVETNNSFDRAHRSEKAWDYLPIGNDAAPLMFVCSTGYGDGTYEVEGDFSQERLCAISINFIGD